MKALGNEAFTPTVQKDNANPKSYQIKALKPLEVTEVMVDGAKRDPHLRLTFTGVVLCLKYGVEGVTDFNDIPSAHHAELATAIFNKALLAEEERKNSL